MPNANSIAAQPAEWRTFNTTIAIPACRLPREELKRLYQIIDRKQREYGQTIIDKQVQQEGETAEAFEARKRLVTEAFVTSVTITGSNSETILAHSEAIFDHETLPNNIASVFYCTKTIPAVTLNHQAENFITVLLDFSLPPLFDFNNLPSLATNNVSNITITARDEQWFVVSRTRLMEFFEARKTNYDFLHRAAIYDLFLTFAGLPIAVWASIRTATSFSDIDKLPPIPRSLLYVYIFYFILILFRLAFSYARWLFPKIEMSSNITSKTLWHRSALIAILLGVVSTFVTDIIKLLF
jgi:hypothetical protein